MVTKQSGLCRPSQLEGFRNPMRVFFLSTSRRRSCSFTRTFPSIPYPLATICKSFHFWTPITYLSSSWSRSWSFLRRLDLRFSVLLSLLSQLVSALLIFISAKNPKVSPFLALLLLLYVYWLVKGLEVSYFVDGFFFWYLFLYFYHLACWPWNYWEVRIFVVSSMMLVTQCLFYFMRYHIDIVMSFRRYSCFTLCGIISISLCLYAGILFFFFFFADTRLLSLYSSSIDNIISSLSFMWSEV